MKKIKLLLYCTKTKPYLYREDDDTFKLENKKLNEDISEYKKYYGLNNGKIVAECDYEIEEIQTIERWDYSDSLYETQTLREDELLNKSCLSYEELDKYLNGENGYAIHIKNLHIYDKPRELSDVYKYDNSYNNMFGWLKEENEKYIPLDKAPQNMMRVWVYENGEWIMYILISVKPEWLCLELNKIKTVEVRKQVLKEMLR